MTRSVSEAIIARSKILPRDQNLTALAFAIAFKCIALWGNPKTEFHVADTVKLLQYS